MRIVFRQVGQYWLDHRAGSVQFPEPDIHLVQLGGEPGFSAPVS